MKNKIAIALISPRTDITVTYIDKNGKTAYVDITEEEAERYYDAELYKGNVSVGILRKEKNKDKKTLKLELFENSEVKIGDKLKINSQLICKGDMLYSSDIVSEISRILKENVDLVKQLNEKQIYFTDVLCGFDLIRLNQAEFFDVILPIYLVNSDENFKSGNGAGVVFKDKRFILDTAKRDYISKICNDASLNYQIFIGDAGTMLENLKCSSKNADIIPIAIPCKHLKTRLQEVSANDIKSASELLKLLIEKE